MWLIEFCRLLLVKQKHYLVTWAWRKLGSRPTTLTSFLMKMESHLPLSDSLLDKVTICICCCCVVYHILYISIKKFMYTRVRVAQLGKVWTANQTFGRLMPNCAKLIKKAFSKLLTLVLGSFWLRPQREGPVHRNNTSKSLINPPLRIEQMLRLASWCN